MKKGNKENERARKQLREIMPTYLVESGNLDMVKVAISGGYSY